MEAREGGKRVTRTQAGRLVWAVIHRETKYKPDWQSVTQFMRSRRRRAEGRIAREMFTVARNHNS